MANTYKSKSDIKTVKPDFKPVFVQHNHARLEIKLMDNRLPYDLSMVDRVEFTHERPDGMVIIHPGEIINGIICYEYKGSEMDVLGKVQTSLAVIDADDKTVSSHPFVVEIKENQRDKPFNPAEPNFGLLQTLINDVEDLKGNGGGGGVGGGKDGYTPIKGVDYFDGQDGYTPIKDVDYRDGVDGRTPVKGVDYVDGKDGEDGYTPVKGVDYFDGKDGKSFAYADFTTQQLEALRGLPGAPGKDAPTNFGGKFEWRLNTTTNSLDLVTLP